jgi:hypothetical protein
MLLEKDKWYQAGDIISFKLTNGDECVAKIITADATGWNVSRPCTVVPGQRGLGLIQSLFSGEPDAPVRLDRHHVLMHQPSIKEMKNHYLEVTTGLKVAPSPSLVI